ncbi:MAG: single-stranded DNA-binding protein [Rhodospirillales bacterium]|nr:single-stranded DNA-binding protein [Rhodospirillales bacterium]MDE0377626.1 single-stranded DNA-binding protein [Rhodospirillales bacterium]
MLNMNRATLLGHAGRDPEMRDLKNGGKAAVFTLATTEKWTDREGRPGEATEWHRIVVYGPAVEPVGKMLRKGAAVLVEGRIATRGFTDREGNDRAVTEIVVAGAQGTVNILSARRPDPDPSEPAEGATDQAADTANAGAGDPGSGSGAGSAELEEAA